LRGLGIFGSGWHIQTCKVESPLLPLECIGVVVALSNAVSSISTMLALRFLEVVKGGLSSGVNGVLDSRDGLGERRRERVVTFRDPRLLLGAEVF